MAWQDVLRVQLRSNEGRRAWVEFDIKPTATQGQVDTLREKLAAFSRGRVALVSREVLVSTPDAEVGTNGAYSTHRDIVRLRLACQDGTIIPRAIPCVRETLIGEDTKSLLYTQTAVTDLVSAMSAIVVSEDGSPVTDLIQGFRDYVKKW